MRLQHKNRTVTKEQTKDEINTLPSSAPAAHIPDEVLQAAERSRAGSMSTAELLCKGYFGTWTAVSHVHLAPAVSFPHGISTRGSSIAVNVTSTPQTAYKGQKQKHFPTFPSCMEPELLLQEPPAALSPPQAAQNHFWALSVSGKYLHYPWLFVQLHLYRVMCLSLLEFRSFCQHSKFGLP